MSTEIRLKEGELMKYRNFWQGWKKYYFKFERSYLHYFETQYTAKPIGTTTRGEIKQVNFSKDQTIFGFDILLKSGEIWHLQASSHEERMDWMRTLKPDAVIVDPFQKNTAAVSAEHPPSAPPQEQNPFPANYQKIYPNLPHENINIRQGPHVCGSDSIPPPAYDDIS